MIARIHRYRTKEKILHLARQQFPLNYRGKAIHIYPDFPTEVMEQRQAFDDVRKRFKEAGARIGFIYPAQLRVSVNDSQELFSSPQAALAFADTLP